jgi:hypothetical protein
MDSLVINSASTTFNLTMRHPGPRNILSVSNLIA